MSGTPLIIFASLSGGLFGLSLIACFLYFFLKLMFYNKEITRLKQGYGTNHRPEGVILEKQTIGLAKIRYRKNVTVGISPHGLYLSIHGIGNRKTSLLIPWNQINTVKKSRLYGVDAFALMIGESSDMMVRVYASLFSKISPFLKKIP